MNLQGNTILITGGSSGIGRGLAEAFHQLGNQVIISGRRQSALDVVTAAHPGMQAVTFDAADPVAIREFAQTMRKKFPKFNILINNAGIQSPENLQAQSEDLTEVEAMVTTNLLGPIRLTAALLPLLHEQSSSTIMNVTSGLAFLPGAFVPTYSATKAAMHSYTLSLRFQLKKTTTEVVELIPPYVQTNLGPNHATDPRAMRLADFIAEVMTILRSNPAATEIVVDRCKPLRFAAESGRFDAAFKGFNEAMG
jgi:uncharacterized oxidoreductase